MRIDGELVGAGPFRTQVSSADGIVRIALNVDELAGLAIDELTAAYGAVRTNSLGDSGAAQPGSLPERL
jgi:hypothetical protein